MTIYVVTAGQYSDYRIEAMFSDEAKAKLYCERAKLANGDYDSADIEEWELNPEIDEVVDVLHLTRSDFGRGKEDSEVVRKTWSKSSQDCAVSSFGSMVSAWGTDHDRVRKAYSEAPAQWIAQRGL